MDLRRGEIVHLWDADSALLAVAAECVDDRALQRLAEFGAADMRLVVTAERAAAVGLRPVAATLRLSAPVSPRRIAALACGSTVGDLDSIRAAATPASPGEAAAVSLARAGRLLPAALLGSPSRPPAEGLREALRSQEVLSLHRDQVSGAEPGCRAGLHRVSAARIPLSGSEDAEFVLFREATGILEHVAIRIGDPLQWPDPVPVRLHSACLTGDLFGSLRCDCGEQLRAGVASIADQGGGLLLYLAQEGRGIGLGNKLRAYSLQDAGLDTLDADRTLGFREDERSYDQAVAMLRHFDIGRVRLLTNNPDKIRALADNGIEVIAREAINGRVTAHNHRYLSAKAHRAGHLLDGF